MKVINFNGNLTIEICQTDKDGNMLIFPKKVNFKKFTTGEVAATLAHTLGVAISYLNVGSKKSIKAKPVVFRIKADSKCILSTETMGNEILRAAIRPSFDKDGNFRQTLIEEAIFKAIQYSRMNVERVQPTSTFVLANDTPLLQSEPKAKADTIETIESEPVVS